MELPGKAGLPGSVHSLWQRHAARLRRLGVQSILLLTQAAHHQCGTARASQTFCDWMQVSGV